MTINQIRDVCVRELLFGSDFLTDYQRELNELINDPFFMQVMDSISCSVPERVEFSLDPSDPVFKHFKKANINNTFFQENLKYRVPAYCDIVDSVTNRGWTGLSATISIYYAARYMTVGLDSLQTPPKEGTTKKSVPASAFETVSDQDFRQKWPTNYRCEDGHYVRSKNEQLLDNWLYNHNICHAYEPLVVDKRTGREYISDFYVPQLEMYIEVWGYETPEYIQRKEHKTEAYRSNKLLLLQLSDSEVKNLDDCLRRNILAKM